MADEVKTIVEGKFLRLASRGGWEFAQRTVGQGAVAVAALTANDEIILVEQYRRPVDVRVIELPAGLSGDSDEHSGEDHVIAARRELLEETGFAADSLQCVGTFTSSAGMTDETTTLFVTRNAVREEQGGGVDGEDITTHLIPRSDVDAWLVEQQMQGKRVDVRVFVGLYFLR